MLGQRLPAEWEPQDAIILLWPKNIHDDGKHLANVVKLCEALVSVICDYADVIIALPNNEIENVRLRFKAMSIPLEHIYFYSVTYSDIDCITWARDNGPIAVETEQGMHLLQFLFHVNEEKAEINGASIFQQLQVQNAFSVTHYESINWALEGGAIETDGQGTLLVKEHVIFNKKNNIYLSKIDIENQLKNLFGVNNLIWIENGRVSENNNYIDELVRFCPNNTVVYTACDDDKDKYYDGLKKMEIELGNIKNAKGEPYRLLPLPWPGAIFNDEDERLSVSYASFLIVNEAVLVPIYNALSDEDALEVIFQAFPGFDILGIPCEALAEQGGNLHRIIVGLPEGVLGF